MYQELRKARDYRNMNDVIFALSLLTYLTRPIHFMSLINCRDLLFDYKWPHGQAITILIEIDESAFDKHDGHQVLGILNHLFSNRNFWDDNKALLLMENAIQKLPNKCFNKIETVTHLIEILDEI